MENAGLIIKLPPGFRFDPTDEELVVQYLKRKVHSYPLPASIIPDIHLSQYDPWDLPAGGIGCGEKERYLFHYRKRIHGLSRSAGSGYWKATGKERPVMADGGKQVVGMKKVMVFYMGKPSNGSRTDWLLHEYRLSQNNSTAQTHMEGWVLCHVFQKKESSKNQGSKIRKFSKNQGRNKHQTGYVVKPMKQREDHLDWPILEKETSCVTQVSNESNGEEEEGGEEASSGFLFQSR